MAQNTYAKTDGLQKDRLYMERFIFRDCVETGWQFLRLAPVRQSIEIGYSLSMF